jgi:hypothetical protein
MMEKVNLMTMLSSLIIIVLLTACAIPLLSPKPAYSEYIEVGYRPFTSGLFVDEFADKKVKVPATFHLISRYPVRGYPADKYINFYCTPPEPLSDGSSHQLVVIAAKVAADPIHALRPKDQILIYGRAVRGTAINPQSGAKRLMLVLVSDRVEKR